MPTYTYIGSKKEHSKCLKLNLRRKQPTYTYIGSSTVPTYTYIGSKKEHSKCLLTPT